MKDPFPFEAPVALINAVKPLCDALGLTTLPLHIHEVIFAAGLYSVAQGILSPALSKTICPELYSKFDKRTRANWNVHVVSFLQSCIICALALYAIAADPEYQDWRRPENWSKRLFGYDGMSGFIQAMALGYFVWDLYMCIKYIKIFGVGMLAHAISALAGFMLTFRPFNGFYAPIFLLYELSSPFLNIHWFCDKLGLTGSIYQAVNGGFLMAVFFCCRLVWGPYNSYNCFHDLRVAQQAGHGDWTTANIIAAKEAELLQGRAFYEEHTGLRVSNIDIFTGTATAYVAPVQYAPLWLGGTYIAANMTLNVLNVLWFYKMVETIRKRFPPPFGTKGVEQKSSKGRKNSLGQDISESIGGGEVPLESNFNGKVITSDSTRSVNADGSTSLEVGGKSLRTRRKA